MKNKLNFAFLIILAFSVAINAQTADFTYQGSLNDNSTQANGSYQMRFSLFTAQTGGNPVGSIIEIQNVQVENGVFSVDLNFGAAVFSDGGNCYLQVEVRRNTGENYVPLNPRQQVKSVPYAVRAATSGNSDQLGGVSSSQYVTSSSNSFILNSTTQQVANFNISGDGVANRLGSPNGFFVSSSPFTSSRRILMQDNNFNLMVGFRAGESNPTGLGNSLFGDNAGRSLTTGSENAFIGAGSGFRVNGGTSNTFIGSGSGTQNTTGSRNTFIGRISGTENTTGSNNTLLGAYADLNNTNLNFATAIGADAVVSTSNTIQLGRPADRTNVSGTLSVLNGRMSPVERGNVNLLTNTGNLNLYMQGSGNGNGINFGVSSPETGNATLFISQYNGTSYQDRLVINQNGAVEIRQLGSGGSVNLCRNNSLEVALCSSSLLYKSNVENFSNGLEIVKKLRPVSFNWTEGGMPDFGLVAEEVAEVEPLLTTQNEYGKTEGVKYDRVGVVLVNAVKQQQKQIEDQQTEIRKQEETSKRQQAEIELLKRQQKEFAALKILVCSTNREAELCKTENQITAENPESAVKENK